VAAGDPATRARLLLGARLEALRTHAGITGQQAGASIGASGSKISRIESGQVPVRARDAEALLRLYNVKDAGQRDSLLELARQSGEPGWWDDYIQVLPGSVRHRLSLEAAASRISSWDSDALPVLLQTPAYARAVVDTLGGSALLEHLSASVQARRRELLSAPGAPHVWAIISEAVLLRPPAGDGEIMRAQLSHLADVAASQVIAIQVVPVADPVHLLGTGSFAMLRFAQPGWERPGEQPDRDLPDVVMARHVAGAASFRQAQDSDRYWQAFLAMAVAGSKPAETARRLSEAARQGAWPYPR
jgi:transcriptional regulator with XRE-family HTH domain